MCLNDKDILDFIGVQPGLIEKSGVIPGRLRDSAGRLTPFFSGEHHQCRVYMWRRMSHHWA